MKFAELEVEKVYLVSTRDEWVDYLGPHSFGHDRYAVRVTSLDRYSKGSSWRSDYRPDPRGQYLKGTALTWEGKDDGDQFFMPRFVRGLFVDCQRQANEHAERKRAERLETEGQADAARQRAGALAARLAALGVEGIEVGSTTGSYRDGPPRVLVTVGKPYGSQSAEAVLSALLDRLEAAVSGDDFARGFAEGETVAHADRDLSLGYELRPEQADALRRNGREPEGATRTAGRRPRYDADLADRLEHQGDRYDAGRAASCPAGASCSGAAFPGHPAH